MRKSFGDDSPWLIELESRVLPTHPIRSIEFIVKANVVIEIDSWTFSKAWGHSGTCDDACKGKRVPRRIGEIGIVLSRLMFIKVNGRRRAYV